MSQANISQTTHLYFPYDIFIETRQSSEAVMRHFCEKGWLLNLRLAVYDTGYVTARHDGEFRVGIKPVDDKDLIEIQNKLGLSPNYEISVSFDMHTGTRKYDHDKMVEVMLRFAQHLDGDYVLTESTDTVIMMRKAWTLILNHAFWQTHTETRRKHIMHFYESFDLPRLHDQVGYWDYLDERDTGEGEYFLDLIDLEQSIFDDSLEDMDEMNFDDDLLDTGDLSNISDVLPYRD